MQINDFISLIKQGFDVSFNYKNVFYTISIISDENNVKKYGLGSDDNFTYNFESIDNIADFIIDDKSIKEILSELTEEEVFY